MKPGVEDHFETFEHGADIGIRGVASTLDGAFVQGAKAVFSIMVSPFPQEEADLSEPVECSSFDLEGLFVAWINELLSLADLRSALFWDFVVSVDLDTMSARGRAAGRPLSRIQGDLGIEVKGATFTGAKVERDGGVWVAQCVVDV